MGDRGWDGWMASLTQGHEFIFHCLYREACRAAVHGVSNHSSNSWTRSCLNSQNRRPGVLLAAKLLGDSELEGTEWLHWWVDRGGLQW